MQRLFGATAVFLVLTSGTAQAGGPYLGFHGGSAGVDVELGDSQARLQSTDFAWKGFGGVGLGRFGKLEIRGEYVWYDINSAGKPWMASAGLTLGF